MRAGSALTAVVLLASLTVAGCMGTGAAPASASGTDAEASGNVTIAQPSMNLTVEVVGANATWRVAPMEQLDPPWDVTVVEVFVDLNGTVTMNGDPVDGEDVEGETAVTAPTTWGTCPRGCTPPSPDPETRHASYGATTGADGNFSASVGPVYFEANPEPPLLHGYCEWTEIEASGTLADGNQTAPSDEDLVEMEVCTQSYP